MVEKKEKKPRMQKIEEKLDKLFQENVCENEALRNLFRDEENLDFRYAEEEDHEHISSLLSPIKTV